MTRAADPAPPVVMMWPSRRRADSNEYPALLSDALEAAGVRVVEYSPWGGLRGDHDVLHVHWPDYLVHGLPRPRRLVRALLGLGALVRAHRRGAVVWTVHNIVPHDSADRRAFLLLSRILRRLVDHQIWLSPQTPSLMADAHLPTAGQPGTLIRHGTYPRHTTLTRAEARERLGLAPDAVVIGSLGRVKRYKNLDVLVDAFLAADLGSATLLVAGEADDAALVADLEARAAGSERVRLETRLLSPEEYETRVLALDLVVTPYRGVLNSGTALHAASLGVPVLVPRAPVFDDLEDLIGADWVAQYDGPLEPTLLVDAVDRVRAGDRPAPDLRDFAWDVIGARTREVYERATGREPAVPDHPPVERVRSA